MTNSLDEGTQTEKQEWVGMTDNFSVENTEVPRTLWGGFNGQVVKYSSLVSKGMILGWRDCCHPRKLCGVRKE